jgi:hypothetical protein
MPAHLQKRAVEQNGLRKKGMCDAGGGCGQVLFLHRHSGYQQRTHLLIGGFPIAM